MQGFLDLFVFFLVVGMMMGLGLYLFDVLLAWLGDTFGGPEPPSKPF